ncbi:DsbA family protein [Granulicella tundricola]|uniref:DSBA oxidoreductase n=1 Tax=Granulicella tundricola (strain ATCC BAA-1859 / DSM 23138 / MP5ACTX9) TaxID=1198114 RepID=E8X550_GRATM|nr:thioredoxin domain-containing protein [Granulicella tundricola]ADW68314.1 DSBA oxidoreductase [Granulicella tundricola MP5ACTX9]
MPLTVPVGPKDHTQGPTDAPITLVEYGDFQCPSCGSAYTVVKKLQRHFGKRLRFVFRHFPLTDMHPMAEPAAEAAEYAATESEEKFWAMHDLLFENQQTLSTDLFADLAEELELDATKLEKAVHTHKFKSRIAADLESGDASGLTGTPTFYINGHQHKTAYDYTTLSEAIETAL